MNIKDVSSRSTSRTENMDILMNKVDIFSSTSFGNIEEKKIDLRKAWPLLNYSQGELVFVTLRPDDSGSDIMNF